jgi:hypothetical protein
MLSYTPSPAVAIAAAQRMLKLRVPISEGQETLATTPDVTLMVMVFYALANPQLGVRVKSGARQEREQVFWLDGRASPRVDVLREVTPGHANFYLTVLDDAFNLDLAMERIIVEKREASTSEWRRRMDLVTSQAYYVQNVLGVKDPRAVLWDLSDERNPASLYRILSVDQEQFALPSGAERLQPMLQHPNVILHLRLHQAGVPEPEETTRAIWAARDDQLSEELEDALDRVKRLNADDPQLASERFQSLLLPWANISPTLKLVLQWGKDNQPPPARVVELAAPGLSAFGNMVQRFVDALEADFHVASLHEEIFLVMAARLGVFEHAYALKLHVMFSGPPASGKSFIPEMLRRLSIPGSTRAVSYESKRAHATETDQNATVLTHDEVRADLFKPGTGDPELKERLCTGKSVSHVFSLEHGRRKMQVVESKQQCLFIGCTNEPFAKLPDAVHSRFFCREVPQWPVRRGRELVDLLALPVDAAKQAAFVHEQRWIQYQAAVVFTKIYVGVLPAVDLAAAYRVFAGVQAHLKEKGYDILPRDMQRLVLLAQSLTVWFAIDQGEQEFVCSEEIAVFCLTKEAVATVDLQGVAFGAQIDGYALIDKPKKVELVAQALAGRSMTMATGQNHPVFKEKPPRVLCTYLQQDPLAVLVEAIRGVARPGYVMGMTRRGEGEPHKWQRVA